MVWVNICFYYYINVMCGLECILLGRLTILMPFKLALCFESYFYGVRYFNDYSETLTPATLSETKNEKWRIHMKTWYKLGPRDLSENKD